MKKKIILMAVSVLLVIGFLIGCAQPVNNANDAKIKDRAGMEINIPTEITSIISMAPSMTQTIIDLGLGDKIVAMDTQSAMIHNPDSSMPTFDMLTPDVESMIALKPSVVFVSGVSMMGDEANDPFAPLKKLGICVAYIPSSESIEGVKEDLRFISLVLGEKEKGEALIKTMENDMEEIKKMVDASAPQKKVYFEIASAPNMYSFGSGVFLNDILEMLCAKNVLADQESWLAVDAESVVKANPDVIFTNVNYIDDPVSEILSRQGWENIDAIKNKQVFYIDNTYSSLPNHNIVKAMREMADYLYGDKSSEQ